mgnify:FL=1|jgi:hypothetical protein
MTIDWEFELEKAQGLASSKEIYEVINLREDGILHKLAYKTKLGVDIKYLIPESLYKEGFARMEIDGLPLEISMLPDNSVELFWPVGMHEHSVRSN